MDVYNFVNKQLDLLELEKNAELEQSKNLLNSLSLQRLQLKGLCLLKLKIDHKSTGLYGRTIVVFSSSIPGKSINTQHFSSGDIVSISENSVPTNQINKSSLSGTVTRVSVDTVSVAIDNDIENIDEQLTDNDKYKLVKLCNEITNKRIKSALLKLKESKLNERSAHLADILYLSVRPDKVQRVDELTFFNNRLDESQQEAVRFTFEQKDLSIIHGPPGTGKTTTLIEIIKQNCLKYKQKILCCAPSNIAVDNLVERLIPTESGYQPIKMIRLGHPARLLEHIQEYSLDSAITKSEQYQLANDIKNDMDKTLKAMRKTQRSERESMKREMRELRKELYVREERAIKDVLQKSDCILATLTTANEDGPLKHLKHDHFDIIIIDECSQALEAACWIPLVKGARKLIIAGDHLQLPPTIISKEAAEKGLDLTLMKRLIDSYGDECTKMLTIQYRMNKLINNWISNKLYHSKLQAHSSVAEHLLCDMAHVQKNENTSVALVLIDTDGCDMSEMVVSETSGDEEDSKANDGEANIVCKHVSSLIKSNIKQQDIAVITPYNLQMELIKAKLHTKYPLVEVKSVDGFQGREKEAIVLSLVRSNSRGEVGFLADERRINVAITRARRHLCVVCDTQTCKNNEFLKSFIDYCELNGDVRSGFDYENADDSEFQSYEQTFEDIKFQKLKIAEPSKQVKSKTTKEKTTSNDKEDIEKKLEKVFVDQLAQIIQNIKSSKIKEHTFSDDLSALQRRYVHEMAEKHKLYHLSRNANDNKRFITISSCKIEENKSQNDQKPIQEQSAGVERSEEIQVEEATSNVNVKIEQPESANQFGLLNQDDDSSGQQTKKDKKKKKNKNAIEVKVNQEPANKEKVDKKPIASGLLLGEMEDQNDPDLKYRADCRQCNICKRYILNVNYLMHELHCSKLNKKPSEEEAVVKPSSASSSKSSSTSASATTSKNNKIKQNPIKTATTEDFDELLEMFQKSNDVCNFKACKVLVKTLGQNCEFCRNRFCLQHSLAEIHGCGDEAKKQARAQIKKAPKSEHQSSYAHQVKHKYLEKKFHEKMDELKSSRARNKKNKDDT